MKRLPAVAVVLALAGCASKPAIVADTPAAPPPVAIVVAMPVGAHPGMTTPPLLADGSYATPNRNLTPAATIWHLRAALNVAALACRGTEGDQIIAGYNQLLAREKTPLAAAEARYADEFKLGGGDWRDRYDDGMTRLYNFFSQAPARAPFCAAAAATLADAAFVDDTGLPGFAAGRLAVLEQPFTDFYRAYDAWRAGSERPIYALASSPAPAATAPAVRPRLELDLSALADTSIAPGAKD